jgi:hypothetical protein
MKKLTKTEINILAKSISKEASNNVRDYNNKLTSILNKESWKREFLKTKEAKDLEKAVEVAKHFRLKYGAYIDGGNIDSVLDKVFLSTIKPKTYPDFSTIESDIVIGQVMDKDIEKLIKELTKKYSTL